MGIPNIVMGDGVTPRELSTGAQNTAYKIAVERVQLNMMIGQRSGDHTDRMTFLPVAVPMHSILGIPM